MYTQKVKIVVVWIIISTFFLSCDNNPDPKSACPGNTCILNVGVPDFSLRYQGHITRMIVSTFHSTSNGLSAWWNDGKSKPGNFARVIIDNPSSPTHQWLTVPCSEVFMTEITYYVYDGTCEGNMNRKYKLKYDLSRKFYGAYIFNPNNCTGSAFAESGDVIDYGCEP